MKIIFIIPFLIFLACGKHESKETIEPYNKVKEIAASYRTQLASHTAEALFPDRCDRLIFHSLYSAHVTRQDLSEYEYNDGEWHRDTLPCLDDLDGNGKPDSKSEISFDGLLGVMHHFWAHKDWDGMVRLKDYGAQNGQKYGEGPDDLTRLPQVAIMLADMLAERPLVETSWNLEGTHNRHLLAISFWLKLRIEGYLKDVEKLALENVKDNWIKRALLNRINDGSQEEVIEYLSKFPETLSLETGFEGWGGSAGWLHFLMLARIIDGH